MYLLMYNPTNKSFKFLQKIFVSEFFFDGFVAARNLLQYIIFVFEI